MPGFHVENFGCRAARADGEAIADRLRAFSLSAEPSVAADVVVVNTCSVTAEADREARAFIRRTHRLNPKARIVVTGCYAQRAPEELAAIEGVTGVVGNSHKALVPQIARELVSQRSTDFVPIHSLQTAAAGHAPIFVDDRFAHSFLEESQVVPGEQTRPNLKIQEGCGNRCTFCVIPQTRGSSRSLSVASVLAQVNGFVAAGGNELVLSGINLGRWGRDLFFDESRDGDLWAPTLSQTARKDGARTLLKPASSRLALAGLVRRIFRETDLPRLRLSSIEPMDWDDDMIALMSEFDGTRLARHAHLPLQSGSDAVLRRMHRRYRPWHYAEKVTKLLRAAGPDLTLGADVMVGFPGETDAEFEETLELIRALPFGYLHLFTFSPRPGTRAWLLHSQNPVPGAAVEERMSTLRTLAAEKTRAHREQFLGRELDAITLHTSAQVASRGLTSALTENFLPVEIAGLLPANRLLRPLVTGLNEQSAIEAALPEAVLY